MYPSIDGLILATIISSHGSLGFNFLNIVMSLKSLSSQVYTLFYYVNGLLIYEKIGLPNMKILSETEKILLFYDCVMYGFFFKAKTVKLVDRFKSRA